eukprot:4594892-Amphidinium_carterae.1
MERPTLASDGDGLVVGGAGLDCSCDALYGWCGEASIHHQITGAHVKGSCVAERDTWRDVLKEAYLN